MWEQFSAEMESSFETDSLPSSHPIIAENVTELAQLFDSISYSKVYFLVLLLHMVFNWNLYWLGCCAVADDWLLSAIHVEGYELMLICI